MNEVMQACGNPRCPVCYPNWKEEEAAANKRADDDKQDCVNCWGFYQKEAEAIVAVDSATVENSLLSHCMQRPMMPIQKVKEHWRVVCAIVGIGGLWVIWPMARPLDEVLLTIGEPYEKVRQQSRSTLPVAEPHVNWAGVINRPATLRFADSQYGFSTPAAKFMMVSYDERGNVSSVTMSPQVKTLPLDETMAIVGDLQNQLTRRGWRQIIVANHPSIDDSPAVRAKIRSCPAPTSYWEAGDKYQVSFECPLLRARRFPKR